MHQENESTKTEQSGRAPQFGTGKTTNAVVAADDVTSMNSAHDRQLIRSLSFLMAGCLVIIGLIYWGGSNLALQIGHSRSDDRAVHVAKMISMQLSEQQAVFKRNEIASGTLTTLNTARALTDIFAYEIFDQTGAAIFSSAGDHLQELKIAAQTLNSLRTGKTVIGVNHNYSDGQMAAKHEAGSGHAVGTSGSSLTTGEMKHQGDDDNGLVDSAPSHSMAMGSMKHQAHVTEYLIPILINNAFSGAVRLKVNASEQVMWLQHLGNYVTIGISALVVVLFSIGGWMFVSNLAGRKSDLVALAHARDVAEKAEIQAVGSAAEVQRINEEVIVLNRSLEANFKQLSEAQDELIRKEKLAQMGQLTATVAHEIRNPLGTVRTSAFLIRRKLEGLDIDLSKPIDRINHGIERCDNIITELLDFTRADQLRREALHFDDWVLTAVKDQAERLPEIVRIECALSAGDLEVSFDADRMLRVLINMLSNASEAMAGKDGSPADIVVQAPLIKISSHKTVRGIELKVTDNGPGMDAEQLGKIFEPLYSTKGFGVGLGIPAMQQVLQQHGGGLEYESEVGKGTTATAWFPLELTESAPVAHTSVPEKFMVSDAASA